MGFSSVSRAVDTPYPWVAAYRALEDVLRCDAVLSQVEISWDTRRGGDNETLPPSPRQMPWIALVPLEIPTNTATESDDEGRFRVRIDMAVQGTNWDDLGNLAGMVRDALRRNKMFNDTMTVAQYFNSIDCVNNYWVRRAGVGVRRTESPPSDTGGPAQVVDQFASAVVEFEMFLPTIF